MSNTVNVDFVTKVVEIEVNDNETESLATMAAVNAAARAEEAKNVVVDNLQDSLDAIDEKTETGKTEIDEYTDTKKGELDDYVSDQVDNFVTTTLQPLVDSASGYAQSAQTTAQALTNYLDTKETLTAPAIDTTLSISGAGADAQVTGRLESNDSAKIQNLFNIIYSRNGNICDKDDLNIQGFFTGTSGRINSLDGFRCGYVPLLGADTYYALIPKGVFGTGRNYVALFRHDKTFYKSLPTTAVNDDYVSFELTEEDYQNAVYIGMSYKTTYAKPNIVKGTGIELPTSYYYPSWKLKNDRAISWRGWRTIPVGGKISQIVDAGYYIVLAIQNAEDLPDGYTSANGMLQVFSPGLNETYAVQILTRGTAEVQTYMRYVNVNNTEEYSKWNELARKEYVDNVTKGINILNGKVLVCDGDSICAGSNDLPKNLHGWYGRFVANYGTSGNNYAVGGGTITYGLYYQSDEMRHSIADNIDTIHSAYPTLDYLLLEGGTNDADLVGRFVDDTPPAKFGTWTADDFGGNYDKETFCGAVEYLFYKALSYYPHAKIGFIIAMEMGTNIGSINNRRRYFDEIVKIAEKWHIPVLDLWKNAGADARLTSYYDSSLTPAQNVTAQKFYYDGQHPTSYGYDKMQDMIVAWAKSL